MLETPNNKYNLYNDIYIKRLYPQNITPDYVEWLNDKETVQFLECRNRSYSFQDVQEYVSSMLESHHDYLFGIFLHSIWHIGNIKIGNINYKHYFADLGILIGDKEARGRGFGTKAICMATDYAFNELRLHKLVSGIYENNIASIKVFSNAGYKEVGRLKKHRLYEGKYVDQVLVEKINDKPYININRRWNG